MILYVVDQMAEIAVVPEEKECRATFGCEFPGEQLFHRVERRAMVVGSRDGLQAMGAQVRFVAEQYSPAYRACAWIEQVGEVVQ